MPLPIYLAPAYGEIPAKTATYQTCSDTFEILTVTARLQQRDANTHGSQAVTAGLIMKSCIATGQLLSNEHWLPILIAKAPRVCKENANGNDQ